MASYKRTSYAILVFVLSVLGVWGDDPRLKLASVVFRHGGRSPIATFPTDPIQEKDWPQGFGQLSIEGMRQQHLLGELLKERYITSSDPALVNFMNENYTRVQIYVRSTDVDRTLMSVEAQLSGLFPPNSDERFNDSIAWQPIPVHTMKLDDDILLHGHGQDCPRYTDLLEANKKTVEYQAIEKENKEFFKWLANKTGYATVDLTNVGRIHDTVFIENVTAGKSPPVWVNQSVMHRLTNLSDYTTTIRFNSVEKNRLTAGTWLQKVLSDMKGKAAGGNETLEKMKLFLYSAHDTTVAAMASALGVFNNTNPTYASALFVELVEDDEKHYVQLWYRTGPYSTLIKPLRFPDGKCQNSTQCTLSEFEKFVSPLIPNDWQEACGITSGSQGSPSRKIVVLLGVLLTVVTVSLVIVCLLLIMTCYDKKRTHYRRLQSTLEPESA